MEVEFNNMGRPDCKRLTAPEGDALVTDFYDNKDIKVRMVRLKHDRKRNGIFRAQQDTLLMVVQGILGVIWYDFYTDADECNVIASGDYCFIPAGTKFDIRSNAGDGKETIVLELISKSSD